jgi:hypothetical protein
VLFTSWSFPPFFEPSQGEVFMRSCRTTLRQEDVALRELGVALAYSDDDVPDFWHLRPERGTEYTRAVATGWLRTCSTKR